MRRFSERLAVIGLSLAGLWSLAGCAMDAGTDDSELGVSEDPILNGDPIPAAGLGDDVSVEITENNYTYCSGVLVQRSWVLTAAHCALSNNEHGGNEPGLLNVYHHGTQLGAKWVQRHPSYVSGSAGNDLALIQVSHGAIGLPTSGSWTVYIPDVASTSFKNSKLRCYGYGDAGTLLKGDLPVAATTPNALEFGLGVGGQKFEHGDSGGGCFMMFHPFNEPDNLPYLVGIARSASVTGSKAEYVPSYATWIAETIAYKERKDRVASFRPRPCVWVGPKCIAMTPASAEVEAEVPRPQFVDLGDGTSLEQDD